MRPSKKLIPHRRFGERPLLCAVAVTAALGLTTVGLTAGASASSGPQHPVAKTGTHRVMTMPKGDIPVDLTDPPVALGPRPALFSLGDAQGSWYDTGTEIVGTHSLAVAMMPTGDPLSSRLGKVTGGATKVVGDGFLAGSKLLRSMNADLPGLATTDTRGKKVGQLGFDVDKMLGFDRVRATARQLLPATDARIAKVDQLTHKFAAEMATQPPEKMFAVDSSPAGSELMKVLNGIRADNPDLLPVTVTFNVGEPMTGQAHTASSLIWPDGAKGMPFDQAGPYVGTRTVALTAPGLYAFACKVHPYMLGAVVVADPLMPGGFFGKKLHIKSRDLNVPTTANVLYQLVKQFFVITNPKNWQRYSATEDRTWNPSFAPVPVMVYDEKGSPQFIPNLDSYIKDMSHLPKTLPKANQRPDTPGVGEVWFDTQMERYAEKDKSGAATKLNAETWKIERKIAAPEIDMNNPHNMWTDKDEKYLYQTEWFGNMLDVFDKATGTLIRRFKVGPSPTHVMTRPEKGPDNDKLVIELGGGGSAVELQPGGTSMSRRIPMGTPDEPIALPHAQWISGNGKYLVAPMVNLYNATKVDLQNSKATLSHDQSGELPLATGMDPASTKAYMADFLGQSISCISLEKDACVGESGAKEHYKKMDLWENYNPLTGPSGAGGYGGLPIQIAVAPDNAGGLVAEVFGLNLAVFDTKLDKITGYLPCDAGCHGVNFGAKKGGGYYGYITSKFSNVLEVVDLDPNGTGHPNDAKVVGRIIAEADPDTKVDGQVVDLAGMGGQGVIPIPVAYEGWVEHAPKNAINDELTCRQRHPLTFGKVC